jgi:hypothetical protein
MAALLQAREPKHRRIDCLPDRQKAMVLQEDRLLRPQRFRDVLAFLLGEHDALERVVDGVVIVECAAVICQMVLRYKRQKTKERENPTYPAS